jgi:galactosylceramidase
MTVNCQIDSNGGGTAFDGVGSVSAASVSRFLVEYPEHAKQDIIRFLFAPGVGASLHELKVEIGSDINSSSGTEACHCRTKAEYDDMAAHIDEPEYAPNIERFTRGYEWEVMRWARAANPEIKFSAMPFAAPEWCTGDGVHQIANERWLDYLISFLHGALTYHNISFDNIALRNEIHNPAREWPGEVIARYRERLDEFNKKYNQDVKLVGPDGGGGNGIGAVSYGWLEWISRIWSARLKWSTGV